MIRNVEEWWKFCMEKGTSGDMVFDILSDWKENIASQPIHAADEGKTWPGGFCPECGVEMSHEEGCSLSRQGKKYENKRQKIQEIY